MNFTLAKPDFIKPRKKTILGVSLIHGRFRALAVVKDQVIGQWESSQLVESSDDLRTAIREAIQQTNFSGEKISFLVEDQRFVHQYIQVPAMKPADLRLYLTSSVEEMKTWDGPTAWRFRTTQEARGKIGVLLDIWPQQIVDDLIEACEDFDLTPVQIAPLSSTFVEQVRSLPLENSDVVLLVTLMANKIALLVAMGDGTPLFERFLEPTCEGVNASERIGREITRSILFCAQQYAINVSQVWLVGESADVSATSVQPFVGLTLMQSPMTPDPSYWIWVSLSLPLRSPSNFTSKEAILGPMRKVMLKLTAAAVLACFLTGVGLVSFFQGQLHGKQSLATALATQSSDLLKQKESWKQRLAKLSEQKAKAERIIDQRVQPMPGWFLSYIGTALPPELTLNKATISRESNEWRVELNGVAPGDLVTGSQSLATFEERLREETLSNHACRRLARSLASRSFNEATTRIGSTASNLFNDRKDSGSPSMMTMDELSGWVREYFRYFMVAGIGLTLGLIGLVLLTQITMIEQAHSQTQASYNLSHDLAHLRTQWSQSNHEDVEARSQKADQMLLRDFDHFTLWFQGMQTQASTIGLHATYRVNPTRIDVPDVHGVEKILVDLKVYPEDPTVLNGVYQKYLVFLRDLAEDQVRMDLQEVEVQGRRGAAQMNVRLHVWIKKAT